jgi:hypothetical protein
MMCTRSTLDEKSYYYMKKLLGVNVCLVYKLSKMCWNGENVRPCCWISKCK